MVQVDVFWTFGIGASFAVAAHRQIKEENKEGKKWYESRFFRYNLFFHSLVFVPSGVYLLWANTGWETMYMLNKNMPAIIPCFFTMTNMLCAILGYWVAYHFITAGNMRAANATWAFGWGMLVLILSIGWRRFTYAGTFEDWNGNITEWYSYLALPIKQYAITDFFSSHIFWALIGMGVVFIPTLVIPILKWLNEGRKLNL